MDFLKVNISELLKKAENNELVLPNFQRDFVWKMEQQKMLIASFLVNLPIGTFLILEGEKNDFVSKPLCFKQAVTPTDNCLFLLDGQQRLSTIKSIFSDLLNFNTWEDNFDSLYFPLRNKWYLDLNDENCRACFGFDKLNFKTDVSYKHTIANVPIISIKEPNDIIDSIKFHQIFKTKKDNKFHPGRKFHSSANSDFDKNLEISKLFANDMHIPLFDFLSRDKTIIKNTLKLISSIQLESLKNIAREENDNFEKSKVFLSHLDSNIQTKYKNNNWTEINTIWDQLRDNWVEDILDYFKDLFKADLIVPNIKSTELSRATSVFEFMNKGGTPLDTFDIMVAKYAKLEDKVTLYDELEKILRDEFQIPKELSDRDEEIKYSCNSNGVFTNEIISKNIKELFLNFLSLCCIGETNKFDLTHIKKEKILNLKKDEIERSLVDAGKALSRSLAFVQFRCGIFNINDFAYNLMLIPLGMLLRDDNVWNDRFKLNKLEYWYWSSLFSGRYREKQNQRAINDTKELFEWFLGKDNGTGIISRRESIFNESNYSDTTTLLLKNEDKSVPSAVYNGILQYVFSNFSNDFTEKGEKLYPWEVSKNGILIQDHHIIPLGSITIIGESTKILRKDKNNVLNSPLNRTYISQKANQAINSMSIERYLPLLNKAITYSHCLPDDQLEFIKSTAEFHEEFIKNRLKKIINTLNLELDRLIS